MYHSTTCTWLKLTCCSEPEFRLVFMSLAFVTCAIGFFTFGYAMEAGKSAELCSFLWGIQMFGVIIGIWSCLSYGLDAFRNLSSEMFIMNMLFKVRWCSLHLLLTPRLTLLIELYVLCPLSLFEQLGRSKGPGTDHVRLWGHVHVSVFARGARLHVRETNAQLVVKT